nr:PREDICTED: CRAL-TRIO domain-containing protein C589.09, mitochondrial-like [Lepisosteus oculatus]
MKTFKLWYIGGCTGGALPASPVEAGPWGGINHCRESRNHLPAEHRESPDTGRQRQPRPIILIAVSLCNNKDATQDSLTRFIVYLLEMAGERCDEEVCDTLCIIFYMKDFSVNCLEYCFIKSMIWLLSHYYPERLGVWLFVNLPFSSCWPIICKWLDERTAKNVVFVI